jgi:hypothetical protein
MGVLQRNTNGVLSRGTDGVIVRGTSITACCCDGANIIHPLRLCSDGSIYTNSTCGGPATEVVLLSCRAAGYWQGNILTGCVFYFPSPCLYVDPADCRPTVDGDQPLYDPQEFTDCDCDTVMP